MLCQCGCGKETSKGKAWARGHHNKSEEAKRNLSLARKGVNNPMFGRTHSDDAKKRIANFNTTQREFSEETRQKIREKRGGENSNFWNGGIAISKYRYPGDKEKDRDMVRARDNHSCQECGKMWDGVGKKFAPHHVDYDKKNHVMWNRITLCYSCHSKTSQNRPYWQQKFSLLILAKCNRLFL